MTKDRIKDLQKPTSWPHVSYKSLSRQLRNHDGQSTANDGSTQLTTIDMDKEYHVAEFLAQIDLLRLLIDKIEELSNDVEQIHKKMLEPMANPKLGQELDDKTADIKKLAYDISTKLKKMERVQEDQNDIDKASAQWRIKESQIFNLTRRFRDVMNQYNQQSILHRDRCKKVIVRELEMAGYKKSDEELEEMLENGFPGTHNFSIMVDVEKAKQALDAVEARHRDITKIEISIKELHSMFVDLAQLVTHQGAMIDNIEHTVMTTLEYTEQAAKEVHQAKESYIESNKKKFLIFIILIAIAVLIIIISVVYYTIKKKIQGR